LEDNRKRAERWKGRRAEGLGKGPGKPGMKGAKGMIKQNSF
jgi:hypothetical protein